MKVLLVGNYPHDRQESMQRMAVLLRDSLQAAGVAVELIAPEPFLGNLRPSGHGLGKWLGYIDKFLIFPRIARRRYRRDDLVIHICDHSNGFYSRLLPGVPCVVTCHDLLAIRSALGEIPENPTGWSGKWLQRLIRRGLRHAQRVACVSQATRLDFLRIVGLPAERVGVVPNALNYPYEPVPSGDAALEQLLAARQITLPEGPRPFILHVGGNQWYKNRMGVLRTLAELAKRGEERLYGFLAGKPFTAEMRDFVAAHGLEKKVFSLTDCTSAELAALYSHAHALLFPSLAEGFGWPIIEAQACGCPVITTNREPMIETSGGGALLREANDATGWADDVVRLFDETLRADLRERGLAHARRFTPRAMAEEYIKIYHTLSPAA